MPTILVAWISPNTYIWSQNWKKYRTSTILKRSVCFHGKFEKMLEITSLWGSVFLKMWLFFACYCCGQSGLVVKMSSLDTSRCENSRQKCCFLVPEKSVRLLSWVRCWCAWCRQGYLGCCKNKSRKMKISTEKKDTFSPFFLFFEKPFRKQLKSVLLSTCCFLRKIFLGKPKKCCR